MREISYDGRRFRAVTNSSAGEVSSETVFRYHEQDGVVWAEYSGGGIVRGMLLAAKSADGSLDMRYQHVNGRGELMTGVCRSRLEILSDGRYRIHELWKWTCGDGSTGESTVEEIA